MKLDAGNKVRSQDADKRHMEMYPDSRVWATMIIIAYRAGMMAPAQLPAFATGKHGDAVDARGRFGRMLDTMDKPRPRKRSRLYQGYHGPDGWLR